MAFTVKIEPMSSKDLPEVLAIEQQSFPLPYSENLFRMELELKIAHLFVARQQQEILGYLDFWHVSREMNVISIATHPAARRRGVGAHLMTHLVNYGRTQQVEQIFLDVRESNQAAIALYKKFGFQAIDIRKGYYQDNEENALVMELKLS